MADPTEPIELTNGHDEAALAAAARHALHDEELVAALAADALEPDEIGRARALVERCGVCRDLHADLVSISSAHRATAALAISIPRDFRLTDVDAARLRPHVPVVRRAAHPQPAEAAQSTVEARQPAPASSPSFIERLRVAFRTAARPLGGALVAAGLVGVLLGSVSLTGMPVGPVPFGLGGAAAEPGATLAPGSSAAVDRQEVLAPGATAPAAQGGDDGSNDLTSRGAAVDPRAVLAAASVGVVLVGLLLLGTSRRRSRETP